MFLQCKNKIQSRIDRQLKNIPIKLTVSKSNIDTIMGLTSLFWDGNCKKAFKKMCSCYQGRERKTQKSFPPVWELKFKAFQLGNIRVAGSVPYYYGISSSKRWKGNQWHQALYIMHKVLDIRHQALGFRLWALCITHYALRIRHQALGIRYQALGIKYYALCIMHQALGIRHQALGIMHQALGIRH